MPNVSLHLRWLLLLGALTASDAAAQQPRYKRPELPDHGDTNDPNAYIALAKASLVSKTDRAVEAYYWALRLNPNRADAAYGLASALRINEVDAIAGDLRVGQQNALSQLARNPRIARTTDRDLVETSYRVAARRLERMKPEQAYVDSLNRRAAMLDPFLRRSLDGDAQAAVEAKVLGSRQEEQLAEIRKRDARAQAVWLDIHGENGPALDAYAMILPFNSNPSNIHMSRARLFRAMGNGDSALAELQAAILTARKADQDSLSSRNYVYQPKSLLEFAFGMLCEELDDTKSAREAYGRSLQEDLTFFPSHLRLARLAVESGDTADAESELALAGDVAPDDPYALVVRGSMLAQLGQFDAARAAFAALTTRAPDFANGYLLRGRLEELEHKPADAARSYQAYLAHAPMAAADRADITAHLATLQTGSPP